VQANTFGFNRVGKGALVHRVYPSEIRLESFARVRHEIKILAIFSRELISCKALV